MQSQKGTTFDFDPEKLRSEYERQIRLSAALAELQASTPAKALKAGAPGAVPDFPPDPDFFKGLKILGRYAVEAINHLPDSAGIVGGITKLLATEDGRKLLGRLKDALVNKKDDPALFKDIIQALGGGINGYGTLQLGVASEAHLGAGIVGVTGVALPVRGNGKVKWFSGMEKSFGLAFELSASLLIGQRIEEPEHLTGQFYGAHAGIEIGASLGSNLYFDTSDDLKYQGFATTVGVGIGAGITVLSGFELVTSH